MKRQSIYKCMYYTITLGEEKRKNVSVDECTQSFASTDVEGQGRVVALAENRN